jgi:hypothetical protein
MALGRFRKRVGVLPRCTAHAGLLSPLWADGGASCPEGKR